MFNTGHDPFAVDFFCVVETFILVTKAFTRGKNLFSVSGDRVPSRKRRVCLYPLMPPNCRL